MMRGMLPFSVDDIRLKFSTYDRPSIVVPQSFGHIHVAQPRIPGGWGMLGNDLKGDCTIAGIAHGLMVWQIATRKPITIFHANLIIQQYLQLTGGSDDGLDPIQVANWWRKTGLQDDNGVKHRIDSYTGVNSVIQSVKAAYLFGFSGIGLMLPGSADRQFSQGHIWDDLHGTPEEGHYVPLVGRNSYGNLMVVTWGKLQAMTMAYFERYFAGAVAYTSLDYMLATGKSPEGFDFNQLNADLKALK